MSKIYCAGNIKRDRRTKTRMPARDLRALLRDNVEVLLPVGALHTAKVAEQSERQHLRNMAAMFDQGAR